MRKFVNAANKINAIRNVFKDGEWLKANEIAARLKKEGYKIKDRNIQMFIYHTMLHKYLRKDLINGTNAYTISY